MTKKDILSIACKIFGIYLLIRVLESFQLVAMAVSFLFQAPSIVEDVTNIWFFISTVVPFLLFIAVAFCLIKWSDDIAEKLYGQRGENNIKDAIDKDTLQEIAFSAIGVFIIAAALPEIPQLVVNLSVQGPMREVAISGARLLSVKFILKIAIGAFLFFGSKNLIKLLKKFRNKVSKIKW